MSVHRPISIAACLAFAASGPASPEQPTLSEVISEVIEVRVVNVDAFVSDRRGRPVSGLGREDFEVLVDGSPVEITNFHAAAAPPAAAEGAAAARAPADVSRLQLAIAVDSSHVETRARRQALARVREFLRARLRPGDRVLLAAANRSALAPLHDFTDRLDLLEQGLDEIDATAARDLRSAEFREILQEIEAALAVSTASAQGRMRSLEARIRAFSAEASRDTARAAAGLWRLVDALAGLPGRKAVLYLGGGLSLRPGEALSGALTQALGRYATSLPEGTPVPDLPGRSLEDDSGELLALARHASVQGVAFYAAALGDAAPSASAGLSRGFLEAGAGVAPGQEESWAPAVGSSRRFDLASSLELLAGATGGLASAGRDVGRLLDRLQGDGQAFYSLGIRPPEGGSGETHRLEVRVRGKGREVRHRRTFRVLSRDEEAAARTLSAQGADAGEYPPEVLLEAAEPPASPPMPAAVATPVPEPRVAAKTLPAPAVGHRARARGRPVLPRPEIAAGYRQALRLLAAGEAEAAAAALRGLETGADRLAPGAAFLELEKIQWSVLAELAGPSWDALLPVVLLHADLVADYRSRGSGPLAEHSLRVGRRLATTLARQAAAPGERADAARALIELAGLLLRAGRLGGCEELFAQALELEEASAVAWLGLALSRERRGDYRGAAAALERLTALAPDHAEGRLRLALNLERLDRYDRSRPLLESLAGAEAPPWVGVLASEEAARIEVREERLDRAAEGLRRARERWPDHPGLRIQEALVLDRSGRPREALEVIAGLVARGPDDGAWRGESPRRRYNRWPAAELEASRRELEGRAAARLSDLGRLLESSP